MLRRINDMPSRTVGFEAVGDVEDEDRDEVGGPALRSEIAAGRKVAEGVESPS